MTPSWTQAAPAVVPHVHLGQPRPHLLLLLQDPVELRLAVLVLTAAQRVRDALKRINKRARKVIRGVHLAAAQHRSMQVNA